MGLFEKIKEAWADPPVDKQAIEASKNQPVIYSQVVTSAYGDVLRSWNVPTPSKALLVSGDSERTLFTYDSEPLKSVRKNEVVTVSAFIGDASMVSRSTGLVWDTLKDGDMLMLYNRRPIGFSSVPRSVVMEAAMYGYELQFKARCYGMLKGYKGVKEMRLIAPKTIDISGFFQ